MKMSPEAEELLNKRIVLIVGAIDDEQSTNVIAQMLFLQYEDAHEPIIVRINSPGGRVTAGMAIMDTIRSLSPPVHTECRDQAHGMAAIILASGRRGQRVAGERAELSLVPVDSDKVAANDVRLKRTQKALAEVLGELCGQPNNVVAEALVNGRSFTPQGALEFGLVDRVGQ